jgi:hypothetical protein
MTDGQKYVEELVNKLEIAIGQKYLPVDGEEAQVAWEKALDDIMQKDGFSVAEAAKAEMVARGYLAV